MPVIYRAMFMRKYYMMIIIIDDLISIKCVLVMTITIYLI